MRHAPTAVLTGALLLLFSAAGPTYELLACGEKYIVPSRGTRFSRAPLPRRDASILVYASDASGLSRLNARLPVEATLQKAGYRPTVVSTSQQLSTALATGRWDLIVIDVGDVQLVSNVSQVATTAVLPVSYALSNDKWKAARQQYPAAVKAPGKASAFVEMIDIALEKHRATRPAAGGRS
jgi:hypothetical protein